MLPACSSAFCPFSCSVSTRGVLEAPPAAPANTPQQPSALFSLLRFCPWSGTLSDNWQAVPWLLIVILVGSSFQRAPGAFWVFAFVSAVPRAQLAWVPVRGGGKLRPPRRRTTTDGSRGEHGRGFLGPQRTCVLGVCLRACELRAVGTAERGGLPSPSQV